MRLNETELCDLRRLQANYEPIWNQNRLWAHSEPIPNQQTDTQSGLQNTKLAFQNVLACARGTH